MALPINNIRNDLNSPRRRRAARRARTGAAVRRMPALALVLEGASRTKVAQAAGVGRQTLRDWVHRSNDEGLAGLTDRHGEAGPKCLLTSKQEAEVAKCVRYGPDSAEHGVVRWRWVDLARTIEAAFGVMRAERSNSTVLYRLGSDGWWRGLALLVMTSRHKRFSKQLRRSHRPSAARACPRQAAGALVAR